MGDRANIIVKVQGQTDLYLYSHWSGYRINDVVQKALVRGQTRWFDAQYLARILFCELVSKENWDGTTGYGISTFECDGGNDIVVDISNQTVSPNSMPTFSFSDYVTLDLNTAVPNE